MTATETKPLAAMQYGLLRMIDDEPGMTFAQLKAEVPGVSREALRLDLIRLAEERMIAAAHFRADGDRPPLRYYSTPKGVMMLRQFERESLPKPAVPKPILHVAAQWGAVVLLLSVLLYSSCS